MMYTQQITLIMAVVRSATNNSLYVLLIISLLCEYEQIIIILHYHVLYLTVGNLQVVFVLVSHHPLVIVDITDHYSLQL